MDRAEFLAMLDVPDGFNYPTLADYQRALDEIHALEKAETQPIATPVMERDAFGIGIGHRTTATTMQQVQLAKLIGSNMNGATQAETIKMCADCSHRTRSGKCNAPQQPNYADLFGSNSLMCDSTIRQFECHGKWWKAR